MMNREENYKPDTFIQKMKEKVRCMKRDTLALYYAYGNPSTPWTAKVLIWLTVGYLLSPIDLIPDFIPVLGLLDDLIIVPLLIIASIRLIPKKVWQASLAQAETAPINLKANWLFATLIILIWLLAIAFFAFLFLH